MSQPTLVDLARTVLRDLHGERAALTARISDLQTRIAAGTRLGELAQLADDLAEVAREADRRIRCIAVLEGPCRLATDLTSEGS